MGCVCPGAFSPDKERSVQIYGVAQNVRSRHVIYQEKGKFYINQPALPVLPFPGGPKKSDAKAKAKGKKEQLCGFEFDYRWMGKDFELEIIRGFKEMDKGKAGKINQVLSGTREPDLVCGREHLLFAGMVEVLQPKLGAKVVPVLAVLSTGMIVVINSGNGAIVFASHLLDLTLGNVEKGLEKCNVQFDFAPTLSKELKPIQGDNDLRVNWEHSLALVVSTEQAQALATALQKLSLVIRSIPVRWTAGKDYVIKSQMPAVPLDGGFLSHVRAVSGYFGISLATFSAGQEYFAAAPFMEADLTGMEPKNDQLGVAVSQAFARCPSIRGFVCSGVKINPGMWERLLPAFGQGTLMKVHIPRMHLEPQQLKALLDSLKAPGYNSVVDLDLSGNKFEQSAAEALATAIEAAVFSMRKLNLKNCNIETAQGQIILTSLGKKMKVLELLDLSSNMIGAVEGSPHPLTNLWNARLEYLDLGGTGIDINQIIADAQPRNLVGLRYLGIGGMEGLRTSAVVDFLAKMGPNLSQLTFERQSPEEIGAIIGGISKSKAAQNISIQFKMSGNFYETQQDDALSGLLLATRCGGTMPASVGLDASALAPRAQKVWDSVEKTIASYSVAGASAGLKGSALIADTFGKSKKLMAAKTGFKDMTFKELFEQLSAVSFSCTGGSFPTSIPFSLVYGESANNSSKLQIQHAGFGPGLSFLVNAFSKNSKVQELDITNSLGGDAVALALGATLKENRTLRRVIIHGNMFSHFGLLAIRSALYGNTKILEIPFPAADANLMLEAYSRDMQEHEKGVLSCRAKIKAAFKSTKGRRTPHVISTLNSQVEIIKVHKKAVAQMKGTIKKYAKVQNEIQNAIANNQSLGKNREQAAKTEQKMISEKWQEAAKLCNNMEKVKGEKATLNNSTVDVLWQRRKSVAEAWLSKKKELQSKKKPYSWIESWASKNTVEGKGLVPTRRALEALVARIPGDVKQLVKKEVKLSQDLIKFEQEREAEEQQLNCKMQSAQLAIDELKLAPGWAAPASNSRQVQGLSGAQFEMLQKPVPLSVSAPPPGVVQAQVIGVGAPVNGNLPVVQGTVVTPSAPAGAPPPPSAFAPPPPSAAVLQCQYEQYRVFQQQQAFQQNVYNDRVEHKLLGQGAPKKNKQWWKRPAVTYGSHRYGRQNKPYGFHGFASTRSHHNHYDHYHYGYPGGYYGYGYPYGYGYGDVGPMDSISSCSSFSIDNPGTDDCECCPWVENVVDADHDVAHDVCEWTDLGCCDVPDNFCVDDVADANLGAGAEDAADAGEASAADVADAGAALGLYAGGEDDRPGKGPYGGSRSNAARLTFAPPRLDLVEWFENRIAKAESSAREAVLGRIGRLPLESEVILQSVRAENANPIEYSICLVTQCSLDRLPQLERLLGTWPGEISVAIYVDASADGFEAAKARNSIREACARAASVRASINADAVPLWTIVAVYHIEEAHIRCWEYDTLYPVNSLRNIALSHANAELVFLLDVDFLPSKNLFAILDGTDGCRKLKDALKGNPASGRRPTALVVPAFEAKSGVKGLPGNGRSLRAMHAVGDVEGFHVGHFPQGHRATDFERWLSGREAHKSPPSFGRFVEGTHGVDAYAVEYEEHFEPYVIAVRALVPEYDERFRGYGMNKISHLFSMDACGFELRTISHEDAFVVAEAHPKSESWQRCVGPHAEAEQRARIATHYADFKAKFKASAVQPRTVQSVNKAGQNQYQHVLRAKVPQGVVKRIRDTKDLQSLLASELFPEVSHAARLVTVR